MNQMEFKDFIQLQRGFDLPEHSRVMGSVPVVASTSISGFHNVAKVSAPGVVTGRSGTLGVVQYINVDFFPLNTTLWVKDFKGNKPKYVYYFLKTLNLKRFNSGAGVPTLNRNDLDNLIISVHDNVSQQKIANLLSNYDDLIENNNKRIKILDEMAQKIYKHWFVDFKFPGHEITIFKDSEFGKIPSDWGIEKIGNLLSLNIGGGWGKDNFNEKYSKKAYVIRGTDIPNARLGNISKCPLRFHSQSNLKTRILNENDIIFEVSGGSKGQPVGRALLLNKNLIKQFDENVICASFCKLLRINPQKISAEYIYMHLINIYKNGEIDKYQSQSTGIINFKFTFFLDNEQILIPPELILKKFQNIISSIYDEINLLGTKNQTLKQTRDMLLPKLISGEIDVENMNIV